MNTEIDQMPFMAEVPQNRKPLDVWKERHGVWTHHSPDMEEPWLACAAEAFFGSEHMDDEPEVEDIGDLYARFCVLLDDLGYDAYGMSEEDACFNLALARNIPWLESITQADLQPRLPA